MQNSHRETGDIALPEEWGLRWWREDYRLVATDDGVSPNRQQRWCEGFFVGGAGPRPSYDPVPLAGEIFNAALLVAPADNDSLLEFVREWGVLGPSVVLEQSLWATRRAFRELQRHFAWLQALQNRDWRSPVVPALQADQPEFLEALRAIVPPTTDQQQLEVPPGERWPWLVKEVIVGHRYSPTYPDPYVAAFIKGHFYGAVWLRARAELGPRPRDREEAHWRVFGFAIGEHLRLINPTIGWAGRPTAGWEIPRLVDLLWVQLWNMASGGASMRQCRHCRRWFSVDRSGKVYCTRVCTNRASAAASYRARILRKNRGRDRSSKNVPGNVPAATHNQPKTTQRHSHRKKKPPR